jgi:hypothetical protein
VRSIDVQRIAEWESDIVVEGRVRREPVLLDWGLGETGNELLDPTDTLDFGGGRTERRAVPEGQIKAEAGLTSPVSRSGEALLGREMETHA